MLATEIAVCITQVIAMTGILRANKCGKSQNTDEIKQYQNVNTFGFLAVVIQMTRNFLYQETKRFSI